jgi:hypothetical protein
MQVLFIRTFNNSQDEFVLSGQNVGCGRLLLHHDINFLEEGEVSRVCQKRKS